jgi:hypothetical protein
MARKISVEITGDARSLERAFAKSSRAAKGFQGDIDKTGRRGRSVFGGLTKGIGLAAGAIGTAGLVTAVRAGVDEMLEADRVNAQFRAGIESTGGAANVSTKQIDALSESILTKTGIDDEATKAAGAWLLTFTKIRNEQGKGNKIFDEAVKATADLATAQNRGAIPSSEQMQKTATMVAKALNEPISGLTSLSRIGIQFTDQQKDQIKALVKAGKTVEAQKVILAELNKEVGGRAAAAGRTFTGQWAILTETLRNLAGTLLKDLMPTIRKYLTQAVRWLTNAENQKKIIDTVRTAAAVLKSTIDFLAGAFKKLSGFVGSNETAIKLLIGAFAGFKVFRLATGIAQLAASVGLVNAAMLGPAGLIVLAGVAAGVLTTMGLKATGLDGKLKDLGGTIHDIVTRLGLLKDPMAQFEGKRLLRPADIRALRTQAAGLARRGVARGALAGRLAELHPRIARRDIEVAIGVHMVGGRLVPEIEHELTRRRRARPHRRRGAR